MQKSKDALFQTFVGKTERVKPILCSINRHHRVTLARERKLRNVRFCLLRLYSVTRKMTFFEIFFPLYPTQRLESYICVEENKKESRPN